MPTPADTPALGSSSKTTCLRFSAMVDVGFYGVFRGEMYLLCYVDIIINAFFMLGDHFNLQNGSPLLFQIVTK